MEFEWHPQKAAANFRKHGVSFDEAAETFYDSFAIDDLDDKHSANQERRFTLIGMSSARLLFVVYTLRSEERIRIISARRATPPETKIYEYANKKG